MFVGSSSFDAARLSNVIHFKNEGVLRHWKVVLFRIKELIFCWRWMNHAKIVNIYEKTIANIPPAESRRILNLFKNVELSKPMQEKIQAVLVPQFEKSKTTSGYLKVDPNWEIYYEESGNPKGIPVVFVHGGPGYHALDTDHCWFDPEKYRIITFDQRGAGKSRPSAWDHNIPASKFADITTTQLAKDMEKLREHLKIQDKWLVFGGSWGSTLSLFYAQQYPERTAGLIVRGIFLGRFQEYLNSFSADYMKKLVGDKWDPESLKILCDYARVKPDDPKALAMALYKLIVEKNDFRAMYLVANYEDYNDDPSPEMLDKLRKLPTKAEELSAEQRGMGILETRIFTKMQEDVDLLNPRRIKALQNIPTVIVQGELDSLCPPENAKELSQALPNAEFQLVKNGKHSSYGREMTNALVRATERWAAHPGKF